MEKKLFPCTKCDKTYTRRFSLHLHALNKHENVTFTCNICKIKTNRKRAHSCAVHTGQSECFVCFLRFTSSKAMFLHRKYAHGLDSKYKTISDVEGPKKNKANDALIITELMDRFYNQPKSEQDEIFETKPLNQQHPAKEHFKVDENTVIIYEDFIHLRCPICLNVFHSMDQFADHIDLYKFLTFEEKIEFLQIVEKIITDLTTVQYIVND